MREIARMLNVDAVLEGSIRAAGTRLRITAQLINVADGFHLWSERFDRDAGDIFAIQDELSAAIVEHLKISLHVGERAALQKRSTDDHEAYNLYLKGLYFLARPRPDLLQKALGFFQDALARDPGFAKPYAGIATVFAMLGNFNFAKPTEACRRPRPLSRRHSRSTTACPRRTSSRRVVAFWYEWDWIAAEASYNRVLALNPGNAFAHGDYAWYPRQPEAIRRGPEPDQGRHRPRPADAALLRVVGRPALRGGPSGRRAAGFRTGEGHRTRPSACLTSTPA